MVDPPPFRTTPARTFGYVADSGDAPPALPNSTTKNRGDVSSFSIDEETAPFNRGNDDHNDDNNHSLPHAEQIKTDAAIYKTRTGGNANASAISTSVSRFNDFERTTYSNSYDPLKSRRKMYTLIAAAMGALLVTIGLSVVLFSHRSSSSNSSSALANDSDGDGINNNQDGDYVSPISDVEKETRRKYIVDLLSARISHADLLQTAGTAQNQAVEWLVSTDNFYDIPTDPADYASSFHYIQRYILAVLYYSLSGPSWTNRCKFLSKDLNVCDWEYVFPTSETTYGINCNDDGEVTDILLAGNNMTGSLPAEIGDLLALEHLTLYDNQITGKLPSRMGVLTNLWFLQLETNLITGTIPTWFGKLENLEYFGLSDNAFTGPIPDTLMNMISIKEIDFSYNQLTGAIDVFDGDFCPENLKLVYMIDNQLDGRVHNASFYNCTAMEELDLSTNSLTGYFPQHFYDYFIVNLAENYLSEPLPPVPDAERPIWYISLASNNMTGFIPTTIKELSSLTHLDLSDNILSGMIPDVFASMNQLEFLFLSDNEFDDGHIPYLGDAAGLQELSLANTNRAGTIPMWLGSLQNLTLLDLQGNNLNGKIPTALGELTDLTYLMLNRNALTGTIPTSFSSLAYAEMLYFDNNEIEGSMAFVCDANTDEDYGYITADCDEKAPEITCPCCSTCCNDADVECNAMVDGLVKVMSGYPKDHYLYKENIVFRQTTGN